MIKNIMKNIGLKPVEVEEKEEVKEDVLPSGLNGEKSTETSKQTDYYKDISDVLKEMPVEKEDYKISQPGKLATQKQVDYATKISDKYSLTRGEMLKKPITAIQKYANSTVEDFDGGIDKFIEYMADGRSEGVSLDEVGKEFGKLINHNIARKIWKDYESGALVPDEKGILKPKEIRS